MRRRADLLGLTLNHAHLDAAIRVNYEKVANGFSATSIQSERDLFAALGLPYVHPHERWRHYPDFLRVDNIPAELREAMRYFGTDGMRLPGSSGSGRQQRGDKGKGKGKG